MILTRRLAAIVGLVVALLLGGLSPAEACVIKPDASTTGPRIALTRTMTGAQALAELRTTKYLSGVTITGGLSLSGSDGKGWVVEDSRIQGGLYTLRGYVSLTPFTGTQAERPIFRYVELVGNAALGAGRSSAVIYGQDLVIDHADAYGGEDIAKPTGRLDLTNSWLHDNDHPAAAHCDSIQIRSGTGIVVEGNRLDAYVGYSSDNSGGLGDWCSGGLQTGSVTGPISATWRGNWFAGGRFTLRGADPSDAAAVYYDVTGNKWMQFGTSVALSRTDLAPNQYGPVVDLFDVWVDNLWEHTGQPVQ